MKAAKKEFQLEIAALHEKRQEAFMAEDYRTAGRFGWKIDRKVVEWNEKFPKGPRYLDLHWMTGKGALRYVVETTKGRGEWFLETGRGNHSIDNIPVIKKSLVEWYGRFENCSIREHQWNKGILVLTIF
uniref:Smr domain-containing protein n=1 Tax=Caenorhabditis tropicalis TaxID=1561998 RepID=A0A1I7U9T2_9PELO